MRAQLEPAGRLLRTSGGIRGTGCRRGIEVFRVGVEADRVRDGESPSSSRAAGAGPVGARGGLRQGGTDRREAPVILRPGLPRRLPPRISGSLTAMRRPTTSRGFTLIELLV